jgi:hypothetical protein
METKNTIAREISLFSFPCHLPVSVPKNLPSLNPEFYENEVAANFTLSIKERQTICNEVRTKVGAKVNFKNVLLN